MGHFNADKEIREISVKDWEFGGVLRKSLTLGLPTELRDRFLPSGEVQEGAEDTMDCASRSPVNKLEMDFNWLLATNRINPDVKKWLKEKGYITAKNTVEFSDAFVAINSGTTRNGNSLKAPNEAIRVQGLIPKKMLPLEKWMTFDDYHDVSRITPAMRALGAEFVKIFTINYEKIDRSDFDTMLKVDAIGVAAYAWPEPVDGVYPRVADVYNHAFLLYGLPMAWAFDNYYDDGKEGDFIKKLANNYDYFSYGYRIFITSQQSPVVAKRSLLEKFFNWLFSLQVQQTQTV